MTPKLLALGKVYSVLEIFLTSHGICQSVGMSLRKGEHFPILDKNGAHKNKAWYMVLTFGLMADILAMSLARLE